MGIGIGMGWGMDGGWEDRRRAVGETIANERGRAELRGVIITHLCGDAVGQHGRPLAAGAAAVALLLTVPMLLTLTLTLLQGQRPLQHARKFHELPLQRREQLA